MSIRHALTNLVVVLALGAGALAIGTSTAGATPAIPVAANEAAAVDCVEVGHQAGDVKMVTLYDGTGYGGACIEFYSNDNDGCTGPYSDNEGQWNLDTLLWNNKASSARTHSQCDVRLWDALNCPSGGAATPWIDISYDLRFSTNWSNRASCIRVS